MSIDLNALTATPTSLTGAVNATGANSAGAQSDRFLKLLVEQMKNQDPLNPMDNAQVTSQMAQISTVEGIEKLNTTMSSVLGQIQSQQAASMIGQDVLVDGNTLPVSATGGVQGGYQFPAGADRASITISDANGATVATLSQGASGSGARSFSWDGTVNGKHVPAGNYTFAVTGTLAGQPVSASPFKASHITGVIPGDSGAQLTTSDGSTISPSAVRIIL